MPFMPPRPVSPEEQPEKTARVNPFFLKRTVNDTDYLRPQRWNWSFLLHPIDQHIVKSSSLPLASGRVAGLRYFMLDGLFSTISDNFFASYVVLFALAYNASNSQLGFLTAFANLLGALSFFPGAHRVEQNVKKKTIVIGAGGIGARFALLFLALIPLFTRTATTAIVLIIALHGLRAFLSNYANPAWTSMVAELVPESMRGRYFSSRNTIMGIAALIVAPIAGYVIRHGNGVGGSQVFGYQLVFFLAFLSGMLATASFSRIPEEASGGHLRHSHTRGDLRRALKGNLPFVGFLVSAVIWNLSIQIAAPFFPVFMVLNLGSSVAEVGIAAGFSSLAALIGQFYYGRQLDRKGNVRVQSITGIGIPFVTLLWMLVTQTWHAYILHFLGAFIWAGYNLTNFNLLLELSPEAQRPRAVALYQTVVFTGAVVGPIIGGYLADVASYRYVFALSGVGRIAGIILFLLMVTRPLLRKMRAPA